MIEQRTLSSPTDLDLEQSQNDIQDQKQDGGFVRDDICVPTRPTASVAFNNVRCRSGVDAGDDGGERPRRFTTFESLPSYMEHIKIISDPIELPTLNSRTGDPADTGKIGAEGHLIIAFDAASDSLVAGDRSQNVQNTSTNTIGRNQKRAGLVQFTALCWCIFLLGCNDGSTGPLLPVIQAHYHIGYSIVSLLFVANCFGYISGAFLNVWMNDRFGFGKVILLGAITQLAMYAILSPQPPFPVMVIAFAIGGFGMSLQNAQSNGFVANLNADMQLKLGIMHAAYGLGAFTSPFIATHFSGTIHWSYHYVVLSAFTVTNVAVIFFIFRLKSMDVLLAEAGQAAREKSGTRENTYKQIMGLNTVHLLTMFAFVYIGVEVTLGGWIVTFIINKRHGGHNAGFISSGFFGGMTLGRVGLLWLNKRVGERHVLFLYCLLAVGLELTIWFVPSIVENAIAVSLVGVFLGPMFPILISHTSRVLPHWLVTASVGWITGLGITGAAALPFITGLIASKFGIGSLQPLLVCMMCAMAVIWACVPQVVCRTD